MLQVREFVRNDVLEYPPRREDKVPVDQNRAGWTAGSPAVLHVGHAEGSRFETMCSAVGSGELGDVPANASLQPHPDLARDDHIVVVLPPTVMLVSARA